MASTTGSRSTGIRGTTFGKALPKILQSTTWISNRPQATDLAGSITDEQVKIEKYRNGLEYDLRELSKTSPTGVRWARLTNVVQCATLQWPIVQEHVSRKKKRLSGGLAKVTGKRKALGGGARVSGSGRSSKAKTGVGASVAPLLDEQRKRDFELKLCHKCHQPGHQAKQ
jgi:hypothetical protein